MMIVKGGEGRERHRDTKFFSFFYIFFWDFFIDRFSIYQFIIISDNNSSCASSRHSDHLWKNSTNDAPSHPRIRSNRCVAASGAADGTRRLPRLRIRPTRGTQWQPSRIGNHHSLIPIITINSHGLRLHNHTLSSRTETPRRRRRRRRTGRRRRCRWCSSGRRTLTRRTHKHRGPSTRVCRWTPLFPWLTCRIKKEIFLNFFWVRTTFLSFSSWFLSDNLSDSLSVAPSKTSRNRSNSQFQAHLHYAQIFFLTPYLTSLISVNHLIT